MSSAPNRRKIESPNHTHPDEIHGNLNGSACYAPPLVALCRVLAVCDAATSRRGVQIGLVPNPRGCAMISAPSRLKIRSPTKRTRTTLNGSACYGRQLAADVALV